MPPSPRPDRCPSCGGTKNEPNMVESGCSPSPIKPYVCRDWFHGPDSPAERHGTEPEKREWVIIYECSNGGRSMSSHAGTVPRHVAEIVEMLREWADCAYGENAPFSGRALAEAANEIEAEYSMGTPAPSSALLFCSNCGKRRAAVAFDLTGRGFCEGCCERHGMFPGEGR